MVGISYGHNFVSNNKFHSHSASLSIVANAINLNSIVKCEMHTTFVMPK